jgi:toxin-antitoxin system PIN domain toxin
VVHLLDVNVLIALSDEAHDYNRRAVAWFMQDQQRAWATCPITENGFVRIIGHRNYPGFSGGTSAACQLLGALCSLPGHQFWQDSVSLRDQSSFGSMPDSKQLTDHYLLGLAVSRKGRFVTFDQRMDASLITGGTRALFLIP